MKTLSKDPAEICKTTEQDRENTSSSISSHRNNKEKAKRYSQYLENEKLLFKLL